MFAAAYHANFIEPMQPYKNFIVLFQIIGVLYYLFFGMLVVLAGPIGRDGVGHCRLVRRGGCTCYEFMYYPHFIVRVIFFQFFINFLSTILNIRTDVGPNQGQELFLPLRPRVFILFSKHVKVPLKGN